MNPTTIWKTTLEELQLHLSPTDFNTWFSDTEITKLTPEDNKVRIQISSPHSFGATRLKMKYGGVIKKGLEKVLGSKVELTFSTIKNNKTKKSLGPIFSSGLPKKKKPNKSGLNERYTFENFVVGSNNRLAHAVALSVSETPGSYNPFFLYSGVGLGKTHLIHALGNHIAKNQPEMKILYCTMETFMSDLITAIRSRTQSSFKRKFRNVDVLLIDDVQSIAGKESTQEELFNTFNTLYMANKQIIFTSDRPPKDIPRLEERLRSRFAGGMIADMQAPDIEMRLAILQAKENYYNHKLPPEVLGIIANAVTSNIRELEGAFKQIMIIDKTQEKKISPERTLEILKESQNVEEKTLAAPNKIIKVVCNFFAISVKELKGPIRRKNFVYPRQITMYLLRELTELPLMGIGDLLGGRDHTTILHGIRCIEAKLSTDKNINQQLVIIKERLGSR